MEGADRDRGNAPDLRDDSSIEQVHAAWLAAGARGDADSMRRLRRQFPQWLDLEHLMIPEDSNATDSMRGRQRFCSWSFFHLPTLGASALQTAAWDGSREVVEMLLQEGQDPDTRDHAGLTPLMMTILRYNIVVMRCVFRNGVAVKRNLVVDCRAEETQLLQRITAVVELLLRFGALVDARNQEGATALHYTANSDALSVARMLVDAEADINAQDQNGKTPLHHCIQEGNLLVANLLVSQGAQIDLPDKSGATPLTLALSLPNPNMVQLMLNHHHMVVTSRRWDFSADVLMSAVEYESEEAVQLIVDGQYASVTAQNDAGETPLHRAIVKRNPQMMELLVDLAPDGDSLMARTTEGDSPAHYAAQYGSLRVVETMLQHLSHEFGDLSLLDETVNPLNAINHNGETCLFALGKARASDAERDPIFELLVRHGARLFRRNRVVGLARSQWVLFSQQVRLGLARWIQEVSDQIVQLGEAGDGEAARLGSTLLRELCAEWIASIAVQPRFSGQQIVDTRSIGSMLLIAVAAGYTREFVPLLMEFPLRRSTLSSLLQRIDRLSREPRDHLLLQRLHVELSEALPV